MVSPGSGLGVGIVPQKVMTSMAKEIPKTPIALVVTETPLESDAELVRQSVPGNRQWLPDARLEKLVYAALGLLILALVFNVRWSWISDDINFLNYSDPAGEFAGNLGAFLTHRLATWTSRFAVEAALFVFIRHLFLWRIITAIAFWICTVVPAILISRNSRVRTMLAPLTGILLLSIPAVVWFDAGYVATTINYLWVLATALLAAIPAIFLLQHRPFSLFWLLLCVPALVFAGSSEIGAFLLATVYGLALVILSLRYWRLRQRQFSQVDDAASFNGANSDAPQSIWFANPKIQILLTGVLFLLAAGLVLFHLTSTGNAERGGVDWFGPTWQVLVDRAYFSTLRQIFTRGYLVPLVFAAVIAVKSFQKFGFALKSAITLIPVAGLLLVQSQGDPTFPPGTMGNMVNSLFRGGNLLWDSTDPNLPRTLYPANLFVALLLTGLVVALVVGVINLFGWTARTSAIMVILALGFITKFIVANTVGQALDLPFHRTDLYLLFAFILSTLIALAPSYESNNPEKV